MNKRRYRTTEVNQVNSKRVAEQGGGQRVVFGVDVAKEDFVGTLLKPDRSVLKTIRWSHPPQTPELLQGLLAHLLGARALEVAMEPSGTYGDALPWQLIRHEVAVYRVSPKRVHDSAEVFDGVASLHDAKAAYQIGRLHWDGVSRPWEEHDALRRTLRVNIGLLKLYQERFASSRNRLEALLSRHWPELTGVLALSAVSLMSVVAEYGSAAEVAAHADQARQLMRRQGRGGLRARGSSRRSLKRQSRRWVCPVLRPSASGRAPWRRTCWTTTARRSASSRLRRRGWRSIPPPGVWRGWSVRPPRRC